MSSLYNNKVKDIYKQILNVGSGNSGLTATLQGVTDGIGTACPLEMSTTTVNIDGVFTINGNPIATDSLSDIGNVTITGATAKDIIQWDGVKWANVNLTDNQVIDWTASTSAFSTTSTAATGALTVTGNIGVTGTVDGRDVAIDGSKLDDIESTADVTDATNVAAAGAIMDSDVSTNGVIARTASGTYSGRTITGTANEIAVTNGDGVSGNPTIGLPAIVDLTGGDLRIPTGAAPSLSTNGQIELDVNTATLSVYAGGEQRKLTPINHTVMSIDNPGASEDEIMFIATVACRVKIIRMILTGGGSDDITFTVAKGSTRSLGANVLGSTTLGDSTSTTEYTSFVNSTLSAGDMVAFKSSAITGSPTKLEVVFAYEAT